MVYIAQHNQPVPGTRKPSQFVSEGFHTARDAPLAQEIHTSVNYKDGCYLVTGDSKSFAASIVTVTHNCNASTGYKYPQGGIRGDYKLCNSNSPYFHTLGQAWE